MKVLIIGGSSSIGINLAKKFRDNGDMVITTYNKHKFSIPGVEVCQCDVLSYDDIERVIKYGKDVLGNDYILINLASISRDNNFLEKTKEEFMDVLEVNLGGMFLCNQIYSKYIDKGMIINMGSTDGIDTYSEYCLDYAVSKAGIKLMSEYVHKYTSNKVICICPNWIDSDSTREIDKDYLENELKRIGQSRLILMDEFIDGLYGIILEYYHKDKNNDFKNIIRMDIKDDKLWIEKM